MSFDRHDYPNDSDAVVMPGYIKVQQEIRQDQQTKCQKDVLAECMAWRVSSSGYVYWSLENLTSRPQEVIFTSDISNHLMSWRAPSGDQNYGPRNLNLLPVGTPRLMSLGFEVRDWGVEQVETKVVKTPMRSQKPAVLVSNIHLVRPGSGEHPPTARASNKPADNMDTTKDEIVLLHLSDIHLRDETQVLPYKIHLVADLQRELGVGRLDYLILSGDIADTARSEEYAAARKLVGGILAAFGLDCSRVIVVPGNHDVDWQESMEAYRRFVPFNQLSANDLSEETFIKMEDGRAVVRDDVLYQKRFATFDREFFTHFGHRSAYPPLPADQGIVYAFPQDKILFLGLNSACCTDHHYKNRSRIDRQAVANAVSKLMDIPTDRSWIKIVVWHHPTEDVGGGMDKGFLDQLSVQGFRIGMHGHIHCAKESDYKYDDRRHIHIIGAGTFGAPSTQQVAGIPLQYHLIKIDRATRVTTVHTRKKETIDGTWKADSRWGNSNSPQPFFAFSLDNPDNP